MECFNWPENNYIFDRSYKKAMIDYTVLNQVPLCKNSNCQNKNIYLLYRNNIIHYINFMIIVLSCIIFILLVLHHLNRFK